MPLWNEILTVPIPSSPCTVHLLLERATPAAGGGPSYPFPPPLAAFDLPVPSGLGAGCFADAWLAAPAGSARLRVAFSLDKRHVEDIQRGLWPCGARYLGRGGEGSGGEGAG
jgi:hypothetical protein